MKWVGGIILFAQIAWGSADFYFYVQADNDLMYVDDNLKVRSEGERFLERLTKVSEGLPATTTFHIYYDPSEYLSPGQESRIFRMSQGKIIKQTNLSETDSTDPRWVHRLLSKRSSADSFRALVFWSHGDLWNDIESFDYSHPRSKFNYLSYLERVKVSGMLDAVIFDACRMASVETAEVVSRFSRSLIASPVPLSSQGIDYSRLGMVGSAEDLFSALRVYSTHSSFGELGFYDLGDWARFRNRWNSFLCLGEISRAEDLLRSYQVPLRYFFAGETDILNMVPAWAKHLMNWNLTGGSELCSN